MATDVTVTTALMGMVLPVVGQSPGPLYAQDINAALQNVVDAHDHTSGKGSQIAPAAFNINADLPFASAGVSYRITSLKATAYTDQGATLGATYTGHLYDNGGDLWWNNASGTAVRITAGNALNAASIHGIGGDFGTDPNANAIYTTAIKTFTWTQSAGVAAKMAMGDLLVYDTAGGANAVTVKNPGGLVSAYTLTLPTGNPANDNNHNLLRVTAAGVMSETQDPQVHSLYVKDSSNAFTYQLLGSALGASYVLSLPVMTGADTMVLVALAQTLTNKQFQSADGSQAAPAYSYGSETGTGWYRAALHQPALSIAGTQRALFNDATGNGTALLTMTAPNVGAILSWLGPNAGSAYPPSSATLNSGALATNFSSVNEVNFWNCYTAHTATNPSFSWLQQTGAVTNKLLLVLDGNQNLLMGGLLNAVATMTGGIQMTQGSAPSVAPVATTLAIYPYFQDAFGVTPASLWVEFSSGGQWNWGTAAAKNIAGIGLDLTATYSSAAGTACGALGAAGTFSRTIKRYSLNANPRAVRFSINASGVGGTGSALIVAFAGTVILSPGIIANNTSFICDVTVTFQTATTINVTGWYGVGSTFALAAAYGTVVNDMTLADRTIDITQSAVASSQIIVHDVLIYQIG